MYVGAPSAGTVTLIVALSVGSVAFVAVQAIGVPGAFDDDRAPGRRAVDGHGDVDVLADLVREHALERRPP